ncbi:MAG: ABC transporter ATP-binding protein [Lachnospiraceae bacterium]|jgi:ABC-2 type transport system ATP-binding protein|nr:ABC transporter ATP-binding protein [Lachnospiraceae bacterium]
MDAIIVNRVKKRYPNGTQALAGLSLTVRAGEIFALLGPNGAGKSTLVQILTGGLQHTSGSILVFGKDIQKEKAAFRKKIAYVYQQVSLDSCLSVKENMLFHGCLYKIPRTETKSRMERLLGDFGLCKYRDYPVGSCSGGMKRRLDIAIRMMTEPEILFLDEPTVGMDVKSRMDLWHMIREIREKLGTTVFFTTHNLEEAERLSDRICIMKEGKEVVQGTPDELQTFYSQGKEIKLEDIFLQITERGEATRA